MIFKPIVKLTVWLLYLCIAAGSTAQAQEWHILKQRADSLTAAQRYDSALVIADRALQSAQAEIGEPDTTIAKIKLLMGYLHYAKSDFKGAAKEYRQAIRILSEPPSRNYRLLYNALITLGAISVRNGEFKVAESLYTAAGDNLLKYTDTVSSENGILQVNRAGIEANLGNWSTSDSLLRNGIRILEVISERSRSHLMAAMNQLGSLYWRLGQYDSAIATFDRYIVQLDCSDRPDLKIKADLTKNLADVHFIAGDLTLADSLYRQAIGLYQSLPNPSLMEYAQALLGLGGALVWKGDYFDAEHYLVQSEAILDSVQSQDHYLVAAVLTSLGAMYHEMGVYETAKESYLRAIAVYKKTYKEDNPAIVPVLVNLGGLELEFKNYRVADSLFSISLEIEEEINGPEHSDVAMPLENLAEVEIQQRQYKSAESHLLRAISILEVPFGDEHPSVAHAEYTLAQALHGMGHNQAADSLFRKAYSTLYAIYGESHPDVANCLEAWCEFSRKLGRDGEAFNLAKRAFYLRRGLFLSNAGFLAEAEALQYSQAIDDAAALCGSIYLDLKDRGRDDNIDRSMALILMLAKGTVSELMFERNRVLHESSEDLGDSLSRQYQFCKTALAALYAKGPDTSGVKVYYHQLDSLETRARGLESRLGRLASSARPLISTDSLTNDDLTSSLPDSAVLFDYYRFDYSDRSDEDLGAHYFALLADNSGEPRVIDIGPARFIDSVLARYRSDILYAASRTSLPSDSGYNENTSLAQEAYKLIVSPLIDQGSLAFDMILISPDGPLNLIPFQSLCDNKGRFLVEDYTIHYVSSSRELAQKINPAPLGHGVLAVGAADYDFVEMVEGEPTGGYSQDANESSENTSRLATRSACTALSELDVPPLPNTRTEVDRIEKLWSGLGQDSAVVLEDRLASKKNVLMLSPGKRVVHLATHGFYFGGGCQSSSATDSVAQWRSGNPLLLSGLLFAGCNNAKGRFSREDNGILSALEVTGMDLRGVDFVVLSACETGLGSVENGEGVYGLRRAFRLAGARTVVSTLWPIPDDFSSDLMVRLYSETGGSVTQKLRQAQLAEIRRLRKMGIPPHPYLWAGYVATGVWR